MLWFGRVSMSSKWSWHHVFQLANPKPRLPKKRMQAKWMVPREEWVKINVDEATRFANNLGGVGVLAQRLGVHQVVVESDSTQALAAINAYSSNVFALCLLAEDVWQVATALHPTQFVHVPRTCRDSHKIAHVLIQDLM
ncbi:hypothetical protein DVH24_004860 [Malus domestica]|uniref:RNase H type-1 domain-containing protein n=1 Tax=Malus domestica TaxID=3750 RepID=A0A498IBV2_MALDO|nr:hypothetical protein DVH24_004860 [Malus domestica]